MKQATRWPSTRISLLARLRDAQSQETWSDFVDLYSPLIYTFCRKRGLQDSDARDVTQQVFVQVGRSIGKFEYDCQRGRFRHWLGRITLRQIERHRRKLNPATQGIGDGLGDVLADRIDSNLEAQWCEAFEAHIYRCAIERIRPEFSGEVWRAFEMVWQESVKPQDAARRLERTPDWVYQAKFQVVRRLKEEILYLASDTALYNRE